MDYKTHASGILGVILGMAAAAWDHCTLGNDGVVAGHSAGTCAIIESIGALPKQGLDSTAVSSSQQLVDECLADGDDATTE